MPDIKFEVIKKEEENERLPIKNAPIINKEESHNETEEEYYGEILHDWTFKEHSGHIRGKLWYALLAIALLVLTIYCLKTNNILFLMIIVMSLLFIIMFSFKPAELLRFTIYEDGIKIEDTFHFWEEIKEYYIIYFPERDVKKIYFIFHKTTETSLSIELETENPVLIRETLNHYIKENTVRKYEHFSDQISKLLKL